MWDAFVYCFCSSTSMTCSDVSVVAGASNSLDSSGINKYFRILLSLEALSRCEETLPLQPDKNNGELQWLITCGTSTSTYDNPCSGKFKQTKVHRSLFVVRYYLFVTSDIPIESNFSCTGLEKRVKSGCSLVRRILRSSNVISTRLFVLFTVRPNICL